MTSKREQFYKRRIAELEAQLKQRDQRIAALEKQVAKLLKANAGLTEQVTRLTDKIAKLSKNSSNSSKPPSSDIVIEQRTRYSGLGPVSYSILRPCFESVVAAHHFCRYVLHL